MEKQGPLLLSLSKIHGCFLCKIFVNNLTILCKKHITRRCVCQPQKQWFSSFFLWEKEGENALFQSPYSFSYFWSNLLLVFLRNAPFLFYWMKHTASEFLRNKLFLDFLHKTFMFNQRGENSCGCSPSFLKHTASWFSENVLLLGFLHKTFYV